MNRDIRFCTAYKSVDKGLLALVRPQRVPEFTGCLPEFVEFLRLHLVQFHPSFAGLVLHFDALVEEGVAVGDTDLLLLPDLTAHVVGVGEVLLLPVLVFSLFLHHQLLLGSSTDRRNVVPYVTMSLSYLTGPCHCRTLQDHVIVVPYRTMSLS